MNLKVFAIYDSKALCYGAPFFMGNTGEAVRAFADLVQDPQSRLCRHPEDYILFQIGEFDNVSGLLKAVQPFVNLGIASAYVEVKPPRVSDTEVIETVGGKQ